VARKVLLKSREAETIHYADGEGAVDESISSPRPSREPGLVLPLVALLLAVAAIVYLGMSFGVEATGEAIAVAVVLLFCCCSALSARRERARNGRRRRSEETFSGGRGA